MKTTISPALRWVVKHRRDGSYIVERQDGSRRYYTTYGGQRATADMIAAELNHEEEEG